MKSLVCGFLIGFMLTSPGSDASLKEIAQILLYGAAKGIQLRMLSAMIDTGIEPAIACDAVTKFDTGFQSDLSELGFASRLFTWLVSVNSVRAIYRPDQSNVTLPGW